jgi:hypothetical protein
MGLLRGEHQRMTGVILATVGGAAAAGGGFTPGSLSWANISGSEVGGNAALTISGITAPITVGATITGSGQLGYSQNGGYEPFTEPFTVSDGDTLAWVVQYFASGRASGTITVTNASDGNATLGTFTYLILGSGDL